MCYLQVIEARIRTLNSQLEEADPGTQEWHLIYDQLEICEQEYWVVVEELNKE